MKILKSTIICLISSLALWSCVGEDGLPGPQGPQGQQGPQGPTGAPGPLSLMYETTINLNSSNNWENLFEFPVDDEIYNEDVVLVYLLWDQVETDGDPLDVWRLMPVSYFTDSGLLQLNYDFTVADVRLFADAEFALDPDIDTFEDFLVRIVVVPADYSANASAKYKNSINFENYEEVKKAFNLPEARNPSAKPYKEIFNLK